MTYRCMCFLGDDDVACIAKYISSFSCRLHCAWKNDFRLISESQTTALSSQSDVASCLPGRETELQTWEEQEMLTD